MTDARRLRLADLLPLLLVVAAAAGARVGYLITYADDGNSAGPMLVQDASPELALPPGADGRRPTELDVLVQNIKEHRWFGSLAPFAVREEQTAHVAPGYPWLLGELQRLLPVDWGHPDRFIRWLQCLLGTLTAAVYYLIAREVFPGRLVAFLTGLLCALHPFWVVSTAAVNDGVLATFLVGVTLLLAVRAHRFDGALTALVFGLSLAGLALVRASLLPFAVVAVLWLLHRSRRVSSGWQYGLLSLLGFCIGLAPWMVRNGQVFGDIFPIVDSTYVHLWMGNNPQATGGPLGEQTLLDALTPETRERLHNPMLSQAGRYRLLGPETVEELRRAPAAALQRRLMAGLYFFFGEDWFTRQQLWRAPAGEAPLLPEDSPYPALLVGMLLGMLLLGVLGWRWTYAWRVEAQPLALAVMWIPLPYILSHADGLSGPRLPLDGVFLCYSAFVLACLVPGVSDTLLHPRKTEV